MINRTNLFFILNPTAGKGKGTKITPKIREILDKLLIPSDNLKISEYPGHATELVKAHQVTSSTIFCIGGDGSLNEIINGMSDGKVVSLGVIPIGSGNDFARAIGNLKPSFSIEDYIQSESSILCDIGHVRVILNGKLVLDKKFISSLGIGFDALVAFKIRSIKVLKGLALYLASVIASLFSYKAPKSRLEIPEHNIKLNDKFFLFAVGNTETAGGAFKLNPGAKINDGYLNLCFAKDISKLTVLKVLPNAIPGTHIKDKRVFTYKFKNLTYSTVEKIFLHIDGEAIELEAGEKQIHINVEMGYQNVIVC